MYMYVRLARREERDALAQFGQTYQAYMRDVPTFVPRLSAGREDGRSEPPPARSEGE
jgi:hypothetical protein